MSNASSSFAARLSTLPLTRVWMCAPPRSSFEMSYPSAAFTTGGPPGKSWLVSLTITLKCARHAWIAGPPATDPRTAATTGTLESMSTSISHQELPSGR